MRALKIVFPRECAALPKIVEAQASPIVINGHFVQERRLAKITFALDALGLLFRAGEGGKEKAGQDRHDGDDDQKFDESESGFVFYRLQIIPANDSGLPHKSSPTPGVKQKGARLATTARNVIR